MTFANLIRMPAAQVIALLLLVGAGFGQSINGYFLADDIWQVGYVADIVSGHWGVLWKNFTGNFMEIPSSALYRPLIVLSMVGDFALWKVNAAGWYITNLGFYAADVILVWLLARQLVASDKESLWPLMAGALFAVYPLHAEPVCWLAGRSDLICVFFVLLALFAYLLRQLELPRWQNISLGVASGLFFVLALLSKEMAVVVPLVVSAYEFVFVSQLKMSWVSGLCGRCKAAIRGSWMYWVILALYFLWRLKLLGTVGGGYTDALSLSLQQTFWLRLGDWKTIYRLVFPFPEIAGQSSIEAVLLLAACYLLCVIHRPVNLRLAVFLWLWMLVAVLPVLSMWGLGANLEASRIYFFASVPFCLLWAQAIAGLNTRRAQLLCCVAIVAIWLLPARVLCGNWVAAGKEVKAVAQQAILLAERVPGRLAVFSLPKEQSGAMLITNGGMFLHLLQPPYQDKSYADRFVVFDRLFTEPAEVINSRRFKTELADSDVTGPYLWGKGAFRLIELGRETGEVNSSYVEQSPLIVRRPGGDTELNNLDINPLLVDFLQIDFANPKLPLFAMAVWNDVDAESESGSAIGFPSAGQRSITIPLSHYWRWYANPHLEKLRVTLPAGGAAQITGVKFLPAMKVVPRVNLVAREYKPLGTCYFAKGKAMLSADCGNIPAAAGCMVQISKSNHLFDSFRGNAQEQAVGSTLKLKGSKNDLMLYANNFPAPGYYQLRCRALDDAGKQIGQWSEPVTLFK